MGDFVYIYPGTFCPPTYGHLDIVRKASKIFPHLNIICSVNPDKSNVLFTPNECCEMWYFYRLPYNCKVFTYDEFLKAVDSVGKFKVMIRGLRSFDEIPLDIESLSKAHTDHEICHFHYIFGDDELKDVSSTKARELMQSMQLEELEKIVCHEVALRLVYKKVQTELKRG